MLFNIFLMIIIVLILYLLAIMPKIKKNSGLEAFEGRHYAHRGLHNKKKGVPENSLKAFSLAVEKGYGIELDVQLTKDRVPIVFHDYDLKRVCGEDIKVADVTYEELRRYRLFETEERIPTFKESLNLVKGRVPLIIELKIPWEAGPTCEAVSKLLKEYKGIYCIESFNPFCLVWYRKNAPKVIRGQLSTDFAKEKIEGSKMQYFILKHLLMNFGTKPDFISYQHTYRRGLSFQICRRLYKSMTFAWTIKSMEELKACEKDFDCMIFERFQP